MYFFHVVSKIVRNELLKGEEEFLRFVVSRIETKKRKISRRVLSRGLKVRVTLRQRLRNCDLMMPHLFRFLSSL